MKTRLTEAQLEEVVEAYYNAKDNKSQAARNMGLRRQTYHDRLEAAQVNLGFRLGKVVDGELYAKSSRALKLPRKKHVKYYVLTSIQNNTELHPAFNNLLALVDHYNGLKKSSCELMVGTFSYNLMAYGPKTVKRNKCNRGQSGELWYAKEAEQYIVDESVEIAPGLVWCGEQNILPKASRPLTRFEDYNGRKSNIVPHVKFAMESVASMKDEATKFNYTTGTITQRNYIQKRAGILAERKHGYGALIVAVDDGGNWYPRQIMLDDDGVIMDIGPDGCVGLRVEDGRVHEERVTEAINWGDVHVAELESWVRELCWGPGGMLDSLRPKYQMMHDIFSMRSRSHHDMKNFHTSYTKFILGEDCVEGEVQITADLICEADRDFCEMEIIPSNHDRHLEQWLNEADPKRDLLNAKYFYMLSYQYLDAIDRFDRDFNVLEWALRRAGIPDCVRFLGLDESLVIKGIQFGLHGDLGANGARGTTLGLTKLGCAINKGHDHRATIMDLVFSSGACSLSFGYMKGPGSHSISHIVTYKNGMRSIITMWCGRYRA